MNEIIEKIRFDYLAFYEEEDINNYLEERDDEKFEGDWLKNLEELRKIDLNENEKLELSKLREIIFKKVYKQTLNEELSAYLSDDFELIGIHLLSGNKNIYARDLLDSYMKNKLPH